MPKCLVGLETKVPFYRLMLASRIILSSSSPSLVSGPCRILDKVKIYRKKLANNFITLQMLSEKNIEYTQLMYNVHCTCTCTCICICH